MGAVPGEKVDAEETLAASVYDRLVSLILSNELPPDSRVNAYALAKRLDVSPTPIREALTRLEEADLVRKTHLKGYRTTPVLTAAELADLYDLRLLLEPISAGRAAASPDHACRSAVVAELEAYTDAPESAGRSNYVRFSEHDARLHRLIAMASGNPAVARALERTHFHLHAFRLSYDRAAGESTLAEHVRIVDAIRAGDRAEAETAMREHLESARDRLLERSRDRSA